MLWVMPAWNDSTTTAVSIWWNLGVDQKFNLFSRSVYLYSRQIYYLFFNMLLWPDPRSSVSYLYLGQCGTTSLPLNQFNKRKHRLSSSAGGKSSEWSGHTAFLITNHRHQKFSYLWCLVLVKKIRSKFKLKKWYKNRGQATSHFRENKG